MAWTRALGFLGILAMLPWLRRGDPQPSRPLRSVIAPGVLLGALICGGYVLQTEGLARTTATNAGFITGLYVVFTPLIASVLFRQRVQGAAWPALIISLGGLALLSIQRLEDLRLHTGDMLVLAGAVVWAGHVTGVAHFSPRFPTWMLSIAQMGATAVFQLVLAAGTGLRPHQAAAFSVWPLLVLTGVVGSGVAYTVQIMGQRSLTATRAVVILAGEAIFAAAFSAAWIQERLAVHQWMGAILVLGAMAYSEVGARRPSAAHLEPASAE